MSVTAGTIAPEGISQLFHLDEKQRAAVLDVPGPVVIHAKPGSGKTRCIASRVALLLYKQVSQENILCVTFTNKAADEMKERIELYSGQRIDSMWIGTFHSICARILRQYAPDDFIAHDFSICDDEQSTSLLKSAIYECCPDYAWQSTPQIKAEISRFKRSMMSLDDWCKDLEKRVGETYALKLRAIYVRYQVALRQISTLDFDDLVDNAVRLITIYPDILQIVSSRFHYICVDEYQDSADIEAHLIRLLSSVHENLCVVGDVNQAVYRWRGSNHKLILDFHKSYPGAKVHRLDTNYRSGRRIVEVAEKLISHNPSDSNMECIPARADDGEVVYTRYASDIQEAKSIATMIRKITSSGEVQYSEIAVLGRMHALLRPVHKTLNRFGIPSTTIQSSEDAEHYDNAAQLMTIHQAKGLEFKVVFLIGLEEDILPCKHSLFNTDALEEECRLCYVAMTRAIDRLYISSCCTRCINGKTRVLEKSRFIADTQNTNARQSSAKEYASH